MTSDSNKILQFTEFLAVRPYTHTDSYWQVYFETNKAIVKVAGEAAFPPVERTLQVHAKNGSTGLESSVRAIASS